jgi:hypothetical protein
MDDDDIEEGGGGGKRENDEDDEDVFESRVRKAVEEIKEEQNSRSISYDEMRRRIRDDEAHRTTSKMNHNVEVLKIRDEKEKSRVQNNAVYRSKAEVFLREREREKEREKEARNHWASSDPHTALYSLNAHTRGKEQFLTFYRDIPWNIHSTRFLFEVSTRTSNSYIHLLFEFLRRFCSFMYSFYFCFRVILILNNYCIYYIFIFIFDFIFLYHFILSDIILFYFVRNIILLVGSGNA